MGVSTEQGGNARIRVVLLILIVAACFAVGLAVGWYAQGQSGKDSEGISQPPSASTSVSASSGDAGSGSASSSSGKQGSSSSGDKIDTGALCDLLGEDTADRLIKRAKKDKDAAWIASHPDAYGVFREHIQQKSLMLAADEAEAAAFVRGLPKQFPAKKPDYDADAMPVDLETDKVPQTYYPHLYQWDLRWGYTMYDGDAFGLSGCGPTAMAMVYQGITGDEEMTPYDMGQIAFEGGFVDPDYGGTYDEYYPYAAERLGLRFEQLPVGVDNIVAALKDGKAIIAHVGPGTFSHVGHYIVLADIVDSNKIVVNDPYSPTRSSKLWKADLIASEAVALYAYSAPAAESE